MYRVLLVEDDASIVKNLTEFLKVCPGAGIGSALYKPGKSHSEIRQTARKLSETAHMFQ